MIYPNFSLEKKLFAQGYQTIAAIDEVGRGAWAGPLIAAAVIVDLNLPKITIRDSKLLTPNKREKVFKITRNLLIWSVGLVSNEEIDNYGLTWANQQVVFRALDNLPLGPDYLLLDYIHGFNHKLPHQLIIAGDYKIKSISLASILAKVTRDRLMKKFDKLYPNYSFAKHKGYGTIEHQKLIDQHGPCPLHRLSFLN